MEVNQITIRGARQHNLKNIDLDLPKNKLIVITGLSGSGKSTLAFDTLYAEGQRRYVESLSTYARQFLERMEKPDIDLIEGLSPAIAIEQKNSSHNPRSTVGTITEIYGFLRLLFARIGKPHCYKCGHPITSQSIDQIIDEIMDFPDETRIIILAPVENPQKQDYQKLLKRLYREGFARIKIDDQIMTLEEIKLPFKKKPHIIAVVIDRLIIKESIRNRLADSLELAMALSQGKVLVEIPGKQAVSFSEKATCPKCNISYPEFTPAGFSFNSPKGACPECDGLGFCPEFDPDLIMPNPELSLREGAITVWANRTSVQFYQFLDALTAHYKVDIHTPFKNLPDNFKKILFYGSKKKAIPFYFERKEKRVIYNKVWEGIIPRLKSRYSDISQVKDELKKYLSFRPCPSCLGARINLAGRSVKVGQKTIFEISAMTIENALFFFKTIELSDQHRLISARILKGIIERLGFLNNVGLSYLTLDRRANTLSGGESQRIRLATQIGSKLSGVLYVLDEPSIGLHQRDNQRLLAALIKMRDLGNTVLVVEHDEETILAADHVVDMGPGAGIKGGKVVFSDTPKALLKSKHSLTGQYLSGRKQIEIPAKRRSSRQHLVLFGASANNLKHITVSFPLGCFICVTGVSGSGKSSLVFETLYKALAQKINRAHVTAGRHEKISGFEKIDRVVHIDQAPIGKTPRSNPGTYTGAFTHIRELFARTKEARLRGFKPGRFSFNVKGGRCEACGGDGIIKIEMHFLPDIYVPCDICQGKRYNRETLEILYKGKRITDVLDMTVNQGLAFFQRINVIKTKLQTLADVGLGYIHLGQPATTLSGGEAQRVKLSRELSKSSRGHTAYFLDEPTTGLHLDDIKRLLGVLDRLVRAGNTVIIIEHNLEVIKSADYVIDLGPEGGDGGGQVIAGGTPEEVAAVSKSYTGHFLKRIFNPDRL